ncbi:MAG: phosphate uptake regulator PhoU [Thaumarchaeota archaeon]|nr:phosphate uptake regulator PhoU [Nitrososphaerota archaeon]
MDARKVLEMGGGTLLISLPKAWVKKNGVRKGATVAVEELSGRKLLVRPIEDAEEKPREIELEYPGEDFGHVANDLTSAYLLGYDLIRIVGKKVISREDRAMLKATMGHLVGLEIMDEDAKKITIQFLLEPSAIIPERIVRRMSSILGGMLRDTAEGLTKGDSKLLGLVAERDDEVDRLYFLLVRAIRAAIMRPEVAEGYGLSPVDVLDYRVLASFLESEGDAVAELSKDLRAARSSKELSRRYSSCVAKLEQMTDLATQAFLSRRASRLRTINAKVNGLADEVTESLASIGQLPAAEGNHMVKILGTLERASKLLVDVSDLAVITQPVS